MCIKLNFLTKKKIGSFHEGDLLLTKLKISYYPEPDGHFGHKVKVILN